MDSGEQAALVICLLLLLLALIFLCCYKDRKLVHPRVKWIYYKQMLFPKDWLIKRCEQDNTGLRTVEDEIIKRMHLREKTWNQALDDGRTPVLVFCVNASRIGTDIESALRGVRGFKQVVIVVLHPKNSSSLRGDLFDDDYLLDQELRERVGIAHFAFSDMEGFYSCRHNDDGYRRLSELVAK